MKYIFSYYLFSFLLLLLPVTAHPAPRETVNRTFTLTAFHETNTNPHANNKPVLFTPPNGFGSVVVGTNITSETVPLEVFIYEGNIFRKCSTSPTGACIGLLTKAYAGALTGWYFHFSDSEKVINVGPPQSPPLTGNFSVRDDPDAPSNGSQCAQKRKLLFHWDSYGWTLCEDYPNAYSVCTATLEPIPPYMHIEMSM